MDKTRIKQWNTFLKIIRTFFETQDFLEIRTPTLVQSPGLEPHLDPFETELQKGRKKQTFYLPTSPEFHLKKALAMGYERIFELKECFRNNELSQTHQPEFLMLEWYRAQAEPKNVIEDIQNLLGFIQKEMNLPSLQNLTIIKMPELWQKILGFNLTPDTSKNDLKNLADKLSIHNDSSDDFNDLFNRLFLEKIEPYLKSLNQPVVVHLYPAEQAALAKLTPDGWADRFELYWKGLELANGFHELTDADEQLRRFKKDQETKVRLGKKVVPIDDDFIEALRRGMPQSTGIALGVERLFMAFFDLQDISELRVFPMKLRE